MNRENAIRISASLPATARVLDVGGGSAPFPRADYVLDFRAFDGGSWVKEKLLEDVIPRRFSRETWIQRDVCNREPWPFPDKYFDYAVCSHLLEDIRDPIWVCSELERVACAGYIETPSRIVEQSMGVENPRYAGYCHHRWLVDVTAEGMEFRAKTALTNDPTAVVVRLSSTEQINPQYSIAVLEWKAQLPAREILLLSEEDIRNDLSAFAHRQVQAKDLAVKRELPLPKRIRRTLYYWRLRFRL